MIDNRRHRRMAQPTDDESRFAPLLALSSVVGCVGIVGKGGMSHEQAGCSTEA